MDAARISEEAAGWLIRLEDDGGPECQLRFKEWLEHSPSHMEEFLLITAAYRELDGVDAQRAIDVERYIQTLRANAQGNVSSLIRETPSRPEATGQSRPGKAKSGSSAMISQRGQRRVLLGGIAASIIVGLLAWHWPFTHGVEHFETGLGEQRAVKLEDGSVIQLNTRSRVEARYSASSRDIRLLDGEAMFAVERDPGRPFRVITDTANILAVGTQFNVYRREDGTTIAVVQGRVRVTTEANDGVAVTADPARANAVVAEASLAAGEEARVGRDGRVVRVAHPAVAQAVAWRQRKLDFRGATLDEVATEFNRYNRVQIQIVSETVSARQLNGVFNADDPRSLIEFLSPDPALKVEQREDAVVISER
jgi:transmembrane sensor